MLVRVVVLQLSGSSNSSIHSFNVFNTEGPDNLIIAIAQGKLLTMA